MKNRLIRKIKSTRKFSIFDSRNFVHAKINPLKYPLIRESTVTTLIVRLGPLYPTSFAKKRLSQASFLGRISLKWDLFKENQRVKIENFSHKLSILSRELSEMMMWVQTTYIQDLINFVNKMTTFWCISLCWTKTEKDYFLNQLMWREREWMGTVQERKFEGVGWLGLQRSNA